MKYLYLIALLLSMLLVKRRSKNELFTESNNKIRKVQIYGERCSGTNYLENLISSNFDVDLTWEYGWKHFFGFNELKNSDDTLFICIVRNLHDWINSFYKEKHHIPLKYKTNMSQKEKLDEFLNKEFWSFDDNNNKLDITKEIMEDRNMYTKKRYKNIFELRHTKLKFMIEDLPKKVNNYLFIKYEDLIYDFNNTMYKIKNKGSLSVKKNINFPLQVDYYKKQKGYIYIFSKFFELFKIFLLEIYFSIFKKRKASLFKSTITDDQIINNPNLKKYYEKKLGYL